MESEKQTKDKKTLAVAGLGYVGLPLALLAEQKGWRVIGIDVNPKKVEQLQHRVAPFLDEQVSKALLESNMESTVDFSRASEADVIAICVPTPVKEKYLPDLESVKGACWGIGPFLKKGQLIILESTVNPGVSETVVQPILEEESGLKAGVDFYLAHCPERISPGDKKWTLVNIPRVVGSLEGKGLKMAVDFYESILEASIKPMASLKEAEAVKIVENSFRDINIAFVNELARSFSKMDIDVVNVIEGAATKPFSFIPHYPGCGVGGHCIPVDPYYLIEYAKSYGFSHDFLALARNINNSMPHFTVELTMKGLNEKGLAINNAKVAVLGLAYKADIDDIRESPALEILKLLKDYGADAVSFDPYVLNKSTAQSLDSALEGAKAVIVATSHQQFKALKPQDFLARGVLVVVDGRNCLDKKDFLASGLVYKGIGR